MLHPTFQAHLPLMAKLFKEHKIKTADAFGSVVSDKFDDESDIDLLIAFGEDTTPLDKGENWWNLHDTLRAIFNREIDLLIEDSLDTPILLKILTKRSN